MAGYEVRVGDLVDSSWGMHQTCEDLLQAVYALAAELTDQHAAIGADEAGHLFASAYVPAAKTTVNQIANSCYITGQGSAAILETANNYLAQESATAAELLAAALDSTAGLAEPWATARAGQCQEAHDPRGMGESLPGAVGSTSWEDRYLLGEVFRGDSGRLRTVAATWRKAAKVTAYALSDAQACWTTATRNFTGATADGVNGFFAKFVGKDPYPPRPAEGHTLMANLPAACQALAAACENYADHIDAAAHTFTDPFTTSQPIWDDPMFGGNGNDGGLKTMVESDGEIHALGNLAHTLDASQATVRIPGPTAGGLPGFPGLPPIGEPVPDPILIPAAYRPVPPGTQAVPPIAPPNPPDPRFPALTPAQRTQFDAWANTLRTGDFSGGNPAEVAYQLRTAGYPEYEVPIPAGISAKSTLMVDGLRPTDGMAIDAKYVKNPDSCFRTLDALIQNHQTGKRDFLYGPDRKELQKYAAAVSDPRNNGQIRGLEIDTNLPDSVPYWRTMMAAYGVKGYARYVP